jgi:hypothetical protein
MSPPPPPAPPSGGATRRPDPAGRVVYAAAFRATGCGVSVLR